MIYRIYANDGTGYKLINNAYDEVTMNLLLDKIRNQDYKTILIIRHNIKLDMDETYYFEILNSPFDLGGYTYAKRKNNRTIN